MRETRLSQVRAAIVRLQERGADVALRNGYGRWGLSNRDESRDISPLLPPKELLEYVLGYEAGWQEAHSRRKER